MGFEKWVRMLMRKNIRSAPSQSNTSITCRAVFSDGVDRSAILIDLWEAPGWLMSELGSGPELCRRMALSMKLAKQRLGLSKVACVKTFGEPIVDGGEKITCRLPFSLIAQEPRQAHGARNPTTLPAVLAQRSGNARNTLALSPRLAAAA